MRIAYLSQSYPPMISGAAIAVEQLAKGMTERGHRILVIAASDRNRPYMDSRGNITTMRLSSFHNPMRVGQRALFYPHYTVLQALGNFLPDIIHAHDPLVSWIGYKYARRANIPITLTVHMLPWLMTALMPEALKIRTLAEASAWTYLRFMVRRFSTVITLTQKSTDAVTQHTGVTARTIPCGIDLQTFHPHHTSEAEAVTRARLSLPQGVPIILHVGRLDREKRVERIVEAAAGAMHGSDAHLLVVGDGRHKSRLIKLSRELGIADRAHFPGYISVAEGLPDVYRMATLFTMASEVESQGIVLLEAAASGLPIVAVDATSTAEIVRTGVNGALVKPVDRRAFSDAISALLHSPETSKQMGRQSRIVAENYNIQRSFELHEQYYDELIRQKAAFSTVGAGNAIRRIKLSKRLKDTK